MGIVVARGWSEAQRGSRVVSRFSYALRATTCLCPAIPINQSVTVAAKTAVSG
jgi:hypothetical protein